MRKVIVYILDFKLYIYYDQNDFKYKNIIWYIIKLCWIFNIDRPLKNYRINEKFLEILAKNIHFYIIHEKIEIREIVTNALFTINNIHWVIRFFL